MGVIKRSGPLIFKILKKMADMKFQVYFDSSVIQYHPVKVTIMTIIKKKTRLAPVYEAFVDPYLAKFEPEIFCFVGSGRIHRFILKKRVYSRALEPNVPSVRFEFVSFYYRSN